MHDFRYLRGRLYCEGVSVESLARKYGTPLYVYSGRTLRDHYRKLDRALAPLDHLVCYAVKANSNVSILRLLAKEGAGFDIVSGGELYRVQKAGVPASRCIFAGVGKTRGEIEQAMRSGILAFNVESEEELTLIDQVARRMRKRAPVSIRVNPGVDAKTHRKITTGTKANKFGTPLSQVRRLYALAARMKNIELRGVQIHIGSQITSVAPFVQAVKKMLPLVRELKKKYRLKFFSIGGGLGIVYRPALQSGDKRWWSGSRHDVMTAQSYAAALVPLLKPLGMKILLEPGRFITGNAGILVTEVLYVKKTPARNFVIVDAAMNDLIRPAFYDAYHEIVPLRKRGAVFTADVVGPICESGDFFAHGRRIARVRAGEHLALLSAGAYGFTMASNYNTRPRAAEVLVDGRKGRLVRRRETLPDLLKHEML
jgi:diaminopimelate decarboxylase